MASEYSFDIGATISRQEIQNSIDLVNKEIDNRFDFKGANVTIKLDKDNIFLTAPDQMKMNQVIDIIQSKLLKRELNLKAFKFGEFESNVSGIVKCTCEIQNGLTQEQTKKITKVIKDSGVKVQSRVQGDAVRVTGKSKDDLQEIQRRVREADFDFHTVFENYR